MIQAARQVNTLNRFLQSADTKIHLAQDLIEIIYENILCFYMDPLFVKSTPTREIDPYDQTRFVRYSEMNLSDEIREELNGTPKDCNDAFCRDVFNFSVCLAAQFRERFQNLKQIAFSYALCLNPANAVCEKFRSENKFTFNDSLNLYEHLTDGKGEEILEEWKKIIDLPIPEDLTDSSQAVEFWSVVLECTETYESLGAISLIVLATPHANANSVA